MAFGIRENGSAIGLFDNEIEFHGQYSTMVKELKDDKRIFSTLREAYVLSMIIGFLNNRKQSIEALDKVGEASILPSDLSKKRMELRLIYRIIMLAQNVEGFTIDDYMNRAFKYDSDEEFKDKVKENMALVNTYACGGLEYLYDKFNRFDKIDELVDELYDYVHTFSEDVGILETEDLSFEPEF